MSNRFIDQAGSLILPGLVPTGNLLWVDAINGNDSLAVRGRMGVPFKTLAGAKAAAVPGTAFTPGDTIVVMPGTYNEKNLLKNYVNWHFLPGALVQYSGSANGALFDTGPNGTNAAVNCLISGHGEFVYAGTGSTDLHAINFTSGNLFIQARKLEASGACIRCGASSANPPHVLKVQVLETIRSGGDVVAVEGTSEENYVQAHTLLTSGGYGIHISAGGVVVKAHRIESNNDYAIRVSGAGTSIVEAREIYSSVTNAVSYSSNFGAVIKIFGARIKSAGPGTETGRAIDITSSNSSNKVRLFGCVVVASAAGDASVYATAGSIQVHATSGVGINKAANANVIWLGVVTQNSAID